MPNFPHFGQVMPKKSQQNTKFSSQKFFQWIWFSIPFILFFKSSNPQGSLAFTTHYTSPFYQQCGMECACWGIGISARWGRSADERVEKWEEWAPQKACHAPFASGPFVNGWGNANAKLAYEKALWKGLRGRDIPSNWLQTCAAPRASAFRTEQPHIAVGKSVVLKAPQSCLLSCHWHCWGALWMVQRNARWSSFINNPNKTLFCNS